jgi:gluconate:H+ symporter, GntP family
LSEADIQLLLTALGGVALLVALIVTRIRLHPLIALLVVSLAVGIAAGMDIGSIAGATVAGAGHTLGVVGIVIALGAMLGKILADSGVTEAIADSILSRSSDKRLPWAMAVAAFVVGIPMFFEVGLVVLLPLIFSVAHKLEGKGTFKGSPYVLIGVPVIAALASLHGMVPPHRSLPSSSPARSMRGSLRRECRCAPTRRCSTSSRLPARKPPWAPQPWRQQTPRLGLVSSLC